MLRLLFLLSSILFSSTAFSYYPCYSGNYKPSESTRKWRYAVPTTYNNKESFYGEHVGGSFTQVPVGYVKVMIHCKGFSKNLSKMLVRALNAKDTKRLDCASKGLGVDLKEYKINDLTFYEIAHQNNNQVVLNYLDNL